MARTDLRYCQLPYPLIAPPRTLRPKLSLLPSALPYPGPAYELTMRPVSYAMVDKFSQAPPNMNGNYNQRVLLNNAPYCQYNAQGPKNSHVSKGLALTSPGMHGSQSSLMNLSNLKSALPSPITTEHPAAANRVGQNNPVMLLPSGQTVPVSAFLPPNQNTSDQIPYNGNGMYNGFMNNNTLTPGGMNSYNLPYGFQPGMTDLDPARRTTWPVNDENVGFGPVNGAVSQDFYLGYPYTAPVDNQTYIAGPIQPMKTKDNKGYEMVNLDELVMRDPPIPRAVPALWTNQEDLSLAKCLQNPEGITNIYIRGFMPDTTDEDLHRWASRFGEIESCKAIIEQDTGKCKGYAHAITFDTMLANIEQLRLRDVLFSSCR